jgi:hypothetical protein
MRSFRFTGQMAYRHGEPQARNDSGSGGHEHGMIPARGVTTAVEPRSWNTDPGWIRFGGSRLIGRSGEGAHGGGEVVGAVLVILEMAEAGGGWGQQDYAVGAGPVEARGDRFL